MFHLWCERGFSVCLLLSIPSCKLETDLICMFVNSPLNFSHVLDHNAPCLPPKPLLNHCLGFLLERLQYPGEIGNNSYAKFWGVNKVHYGLCESSG